MMTEDEISSILKMTQGFVITYLLSRLIRTSSAIITTVYFGKRSTVHINIKHNIKQAK